MNSQDLKNAYVAGLQTMVAGAEASNKTAAENGDGATSPRLRTMLKEGADIAGQHLDVFKELLRKSGGQPSDQPDKVMAGIIEAGCDSVGAASDPDVKDAAIVATTRIGLHYYIAAYGTLANTAKQLGLADDRREIDGLNRHMVQKDAEYAAFVDGMANA